jgi:hypothetical protein
VLHYSAWTALEANQICGTLPATLIAGDRVEAVHFGSVSVRTAS